MFFNKKKLKLLSRSEVFVGLTLEELEGLGRHAKLKKYKAGDKILDEGELNDSLYAVVAGRLEFYLPKEAKGRDITRLSKIKLNTMGPGECFGIYSLIDRKPVSCSVMATEPAEVLTISKDDLDDLVESNSRIGMFIYRNMLRMLVSDLRAKDKELDLSLK